MALISWCSFSGVFSPSLVALNLSTSSLTLWRGWVSLVPGLVTFPPGHVGETRRVDKSMCSDFSASILGAVHSGLSRRFLMCGKNRALVFMTSFCVSFSPSSPSLSLCSFVPWPLGGERLRRYRPPQSSRPVSTVAAGSADFLSFALKSQLSRNP